MRTRVALTILILITGAVVLRADTHPNTARGFDIGKPYQMNGIDNINLFNGNLTITIPIGQRYHVNGNLSYGLTLVYSGNLWDTVDVDPVGSTMTVYPSRRSNAGLGWLVSLGRLFPANTAPTVETHLWNYETPDGALHSFHAGLHDGTPTGIDTCIQANAKCYTRDGSYLRMKTNASASEHTIEFPDGTQHVFREVLKVSNGAWVDTPGTGVWRLREIWDSFANSVTINYSATTTNPEIWTVVDGTRTQTVYFIPGRSPGNMQSFYDLLVDHVTLTTFGTVTSEWKMGYAFRDIGRGGSSDHTERQPSSYPSLPLLTSLTLPQVKGVSQVYSMLDPSGNPAYSIAHDLDGQTAVNPLNGTLTAMQLPSKGWLEWDYTGYAFLGSTEEPIHRTIAVKTRRMLDAQHANAETWQYDRKESAGRTCPNPVDPNTPFTSPPEQLVVSVTTPEQVTSVHYFSLYPDGADDHCGGTPFVADEYGLPLTRGVTHSLAGFGTQYLSEETYSGTPSIVTSPTQYRATGGMLLRSQWTVYDYSLWEGTPDTNSREAQHVTQYEDDSSCSGVCYSGVLRSGFDGAGHFRQSSTRSNFGAAGGNFITSFTNYNQVNLTASSWLLNLYTEQCKAEDNLARSSGVSSCGDLSAAVPGGTIRSGPHIEQFCFDASTGFLARHRKLAGGAQNFTDVIAVYTSVMGNVSQEDYYGGDLQNSMPLTDWCTANMPGTPSYSIGHDYVRGSLSHTWYKDSTHGAAPGFLSVDNTIDANTGLVSVSKDASGLQTTFVYDALGRIDTVSPPSTEVPSTFVYSEAASPFKVTATRASSTGTIVAVTEFDGFGRVSKEQQTLPFGTTSRTSSYYGSGWLKSVSQWQATPANFTTYTYDAFGRPLTIKAPDDTYTTLQYLGVRETKRTVNVGTSRTGTSVAQAPTVTTETYDAQGRLATLRDADGNDTNYSYDVSGHLTGVSMGAQTRTFTYDGRGFLREETHPELGGAVGKVTYGWIDARGHASEKLLGDSLSSFDVAYGYDAAERLSHTDRITLRGTVTPAIPPPTPFPPPAATPRTAPSTQAMKFFTFGTTGGGKGKLAQDVRHNYRGNDDIVVTEEYSYRDSDGKLTNRKTTVDKGTQRLQQFTQSYDYNDIGSLATLIYPTCPDSSHPCGSSTLSAVSPVFSMGMMTSIPGFATSISYHGDGTVNQIVHPGGITDTYEADDHAMARPKAISFASYDTCAGPAAPTISASPSGTITSPATVQLTADLGAGPAPSSYQWYHVVSNVAVPIVGATSSTFSEYITSTTVFRVRTANGCGSRDSGDVTTTFNGCHVATTTPANVTLPPSNAGTTLTVTATGCGTLSYQWFKIVNGSPVAVGGNSASLATGTLSVSTTYRVTVTDSASGPPATSGDVLVTVTTCTPVITSQPQDQVLDAGAPLHVSVVVSGCAGKTYMWYQGSSGDTSTPLLGGYYNTPDVNSGSWSMHGPIWVRVSYDNGGSIVTTADSRTVMISVRPVVVNAQTVTGSPTSIAVTWYAYAHHYLLKRCANNSCAAPFSVGSSTSYMDAGLIPNTTYVYSVASVDAYGNQSAFSTQDIATTMAFTPVQAGGAVTRAPVNEIFTVINDMLASSGGAPITWQGILPSGVPPPPQTGQASTDIFAHILALRTQMNLALSRFNLPAPAYTDSLTAATEIKAVHFTELQDRAR